jgi:hypothetical protein
LKNKKWKCWPQYVSVMSVFLECSF